MMKELAIAMNLNIAACWLKLKEFELAKCQCDVVMNLDCFNVKAHFRRAPALPCDDPNDNKLVMEVANEGNTSAESSSKEDGQAVSSLLGLYVPFTNETVSKESDRLKPGNLIEKTDKICDFECQNMLLGNESCVEDIGPLQGAETKSYIEGENSSHSTRMGVQKSDKMEELNMGGCLDIGSSMELDGQNMTYESVLTHKTYLKGHDHLMSSASCWKGICAIRDVVYKPLGNSTRRRSLQLIRLPQAAYERVEQGDSIEFFDKHTMSYVVMRIHRSDHQIQDNNCIGRGNQELHTFDAFQFSAQQHGKQKRGKHCRRKHSWAQRRLRSQQPSPEPTIGENKYELKIFNANSISWYREDCNIGKRIKCWRCKTNLIRTLILNVYVAKRKMNDQGWKKFL
ncbi:hypothetical protein Cgig2_004660 [Carnegiea gigantea]|uniref:Uncharacterized protein n=1 Tax=Carnegiea gigantea TaxID=171969 RepID=A0A9Q1QA76_9CARY|nr:hypothetical protein Cgig2_004660 [Carnegiea gigantea]